MNDHFWSKVRKVDGACWVWTGSRNPNGYGRFLVSTRPTRYKMAHRLAYEASVGPIPSGLTIDHLCFNKLCVNPAHLEPVTLEENLRRAMDAGRGIAAVQRAKVNCSAGHPLSGDNLHIDVYGFRRCKACGAARQRERYRRMALAGKPVRQGRAPVSKPRLPELQSLGE